MQLSPQPQFRYYGTPRNYLDIAAAVIAGRVKEGRDAPDRLERQVGDWMGAAHVLALSQARLGLFLALRHLIRPGQTVIVSPYTYYEVINMVICAGGRPVFADIDPATCGMAVHRLEDRINSDTGAVIFSYMHGLSGDIEAIAEVCRSRGIVLIEDAAQCLGGRVGGRYVGTFGRVGVFSFSMKKNVNAFFGGMAVTADKELHNAMTATISRFATEKFTRLLGRVGMCLVGDLLKAPLLFQQLTFPLLRYDFLRHNGKLEVLLRNDGQPALRSKLPEMYQRRMTGLQARLVLRQLADLERHTRSRIDRAGLYHRGLGGLPQIGRPPLRKDGTHIYLQYPIRVSERRRLLKYLLSQNRDIENRDFGNAADFDCFADYARDCPKAREVAAQVVVLPTYPGYPPSEVEKNIAAIHNFFRPAGNTVHTATAQR
jgi:dTDP-4-amino-4,6-dideoxygalactose transaminase